MSSDTDFLVAIPALLWKCCSIFHNNFQRCCLLQFQLMPLWKTKIVNCPNFLKIQHKYRHAVLFSTLLLLCPHHGRDNQLFPSQRQGLQAFFDWTPCFAHVSSVPTVENRLGYGFPVHEKDLVFFLCDLGFGASLPAQAFQSFRRLDFWPVSSLYSILCLPFHLFSYIGFCLGFFWGPDAHIGI